MSVTILSVLAGGSSSRAARSWIGRVIKGLVISISALMTTLRRGVRELLWHPLLKCHYGHAQLLQIERSKTPFGREVDGHSAKFIRGYDAGAISIFGRPLDALSDLELAELVVIARWPSRYRQPESAEPRESAAKALLTRAIATESARTAR